MEHLSNRSWALLSVLAGIILTLSFAPFGHSYLAILALALLFSAWQQGSAWQAALRGYCFGLGMFSLGVTWVFVSIFFYGKANFFASALLAELFAAFWALFPAIVGYLSVRLNQKRQPLLFWLMPILWILLEYVRGDALLNGFPWLQIAYSQVDSPYAGFIPLFGVYGTGFLVALSAGVFAYLWHFKQHTVLLSSGLFLLLISGCVMRHVEWTQKAGYPIRATLVQGNISQDEKWQEGSLIKTLLLYQQMTYAHWDSQLIVWPETSIPAYLSQVDTHFLTPLEAEAKQHQTDLVVSLLEKEETTGKVFNSALVLGTERRSYRKNHLLPFGEYMPLQPLSGWVLNNIGIRLDDFSAGGDQQPLLMGAGYPFTTSICYEDAFGTEAIRQLEHSRYLVNLTNDAWFGRSLEPYQHLQMARMRALETGRYMLRATNTGLSAIISPSGKVIKQSPLFETVTLTGDIIPMKGMTLYARLGNKAIIIFLIALFAILLLTGTLQQKEKRKN
jgi:apolipoprotein N-acyltransferase